MRLLLCPDSYKGTMSATTICELINTMIQSDFDDIETQSIPIADGGEGTVDAFLVAMGGKKIHVRVKGPLFDEVESFYGILPDGKTAVIEMAAASGLPLTGSVKDPTRTSTFGTGELIRHAVLENGCSRVLIGIGGSATNDGGIGMAAALGVRFTQANGQVLKPVGGCLEKLAHIDSSAMDKALKSAEYTVLCDVNNPLYGPNGAAAVFGPQKGADEKMIEFLDRGLMHYAKILKKDLNKDVANHKGAGAAGGLGAGLTAFLDAKLQSGIDVVLDTVGFEDRLANADLVITGEGRIDCSSLSGKAPIGIATRAKTFNVPVVVVAGDVQGDASLLYEAGITAVFSTNRTAGAFETILPMAKTYLQDTVRDVLRLYQCKRSDRG